MADGQAGPDTGAGGGGQPHGVMTAAGILLLWIGAFGLYVAFMSGKTDALTVGKNQDGAPQGPADLRSLLGRLAAVVQSAGGGGTVSGGEGSVPIPPGGIQ